jgi:transcriptional regulator with XRE-family HTH domain
VIDGPGIRAKRKELGLTLMQAAALAGWGKWGHPRWSLIERGLRRVVNTQTLDDMAKALRCHPRELLAEKSCQTPERTR